MKQKILDLVGLIGLASVGYGLWEISPAVSKIVIGGFFVVFAYIGSRK